MYIYVVHCVCYCLDDSIVTSAVYQDNSEFTSAAKWVDYLYKIFVVVYSFDEYLVYRVLSLQSCLQNDWEENWP